MQLFRYSEALIQSRQQHSLIFSTPDRINCCAVELEWRYEYQNKSPTCPPAVYVLKKDAFDGRGGKFLVRLLPLFISS